MKITPEVLISMGFTKTTNQDEEEYEVKIHGYRFIVKNDPLFRCWSFSIGERSHSVTDVEEMLAFAVGDGYDSGYSQCKKELREFLEI